MTLLALALALGFPDGRLKTRLERSLYVAMLAAFTVLYLPTVSSFVDPASQTDGAVS